MQKKLIVTIKTQNIINLLVFRLNVLLLYIFKKKNDSVEFQLNKFKREEIERN